MQACTAAETGEFSGSATVSPGSTGVFIRFVPHYYAKEQYNYAKEQYTYHVRMVHLGGERGLIVW